MIQNNFYGEEVLIVALINFGIDFGNGYVKGKSEKGEFIIPSFIAIDELKDNLISSSFEQKYNVHSYKRKTDDNSYLFGKDIMLAVASNKLISTNSSNERYTMDSFQRMVEFALGELASYEDSETIEVRLVTGMPSEELQYARLKSSFERFLKGMHTIERDGVALMIHVKEVKLIEQPLGTLFDTYLNDDSKVHTDFKNGSVVVIDFGSGTTIIDQYHQMKRANGTVLPRGMREFFKGIARDLSTDAEVSVNQIHIEEGIKNGTYQAVFGQYKLPFMDIFERKVKEKLDDTLSNYEDDIEDSSVNAFIITGGGANIFSDLIKKRKNNFMVVENPQTATSNGYYKLANAFDK